jgi:hypothetical protein
MAWMAETLSTGSRDFLEMLIVSPLETPHFMLIRSFIHYRVGKNPPVVPTISQINRIHMLTPHFLKINLNIIFQCTTKPS